MFVMALGFIFAPTAHAILLGSQPADYDYITIDRNTLVLDGFTVSTHAGTVTMDSLQAGDWGKASVTITNGAKAIVAGATRVSHWEPSVATFKVNGTGSSFTTSDLSFGDMDIFGKSYGKGSMAISDGATVKTSGISLVDAKSTISVDVGKGSSLTVGNGTGTIYHYGTVRLTTGANVVPGTYAPVSYGTLATIPTKGAPLGTIQALGGTWDDASHTVVVSPTAHGMIGTPTTINLATTQRVLITDSATGKSVGAGFQAGSGSLTLSASAITGAEANALQALLASGQVILSGWDFSLTGYTEGNPVYLSLFAGSGHDLSDLAIWHYNGSAWSKFDAFDLAYDNLYASFTVTGFSDYAVTGTAPVPIPAAAWLLGPGLAGLGFVRRRTYGRRMKAPRREGKE
jgi:hypothetical protein